ncbi:unnamed protein product, partial [Symbiodinium microadriaticum]
LQAEQPSVSEKPAPWAWLLLLVLWVAAAAVAPTQPACSQGWTVACAVLSGLASMWLPAATLAVTLMGFSSSKGARASGQIAGVASVAALALTASAGAYPHPGTFVSGPGCDEALQALESVGSWLAVGKACKRETGTCTMRDLTTPMIPWLDDCCPTGCSAALNDSDLCNAVCFAAHSAVAADVCSYDVPELRCTLQEEKRWLAGGQGDNENGDDDGANGGEHKDADHTSLLQFHDAGEDLSSSTRTPLEALHDETSFMEQPGVHGGEMADMINAGVPQGHARRFEQLMRRYRFYVTMDLGPEARWALGRWLTVSQWAAGAQDCLEDVIRDRIQETRQYPLQRAPREGELRNELIRWTAELTELVADVGVAAALAATPGILQPLPTPATAADFPNLRAPTTRTVSRSRSRGRQEVGELGHDAHTTNEGDNTGGDVSSLFSHPVLWRSEEGDETVLMMYGGYDRHEHEDNREDTEMVEEEGPVIDNANEEERPFPAGDPPGLLGPVGAEELDTDVTRMGDLMHEEVEFADRAMLVQQAVRGAMHELPPGSAREVIRRMMLRQDYMVNLQFWLHRALTQSLRTCPPGDGPVDWAREAEAAIWRRIMGLEDQDPMVRELRAVIDGGAVVDATRPSGVDMGAEAGPSAVEENAGDFENEDDIVFEERSLDSDADQGGSESSEHRPDEPGDVGRGEPDVHALSGEASGLEEPGSLEGHVDNRRLQTALSVMHVDDTSPYYVDAFFLCFVQKMAMQKKKMVMRLVVALGPWILDVVGRRTWSDDVEVMGMYMPVMNMPVMNMAVSLQHRAIRRLDQSRAPVHDSAL